ncbi:FAD-dependent oxidoreductase [Rhodophyticola porphyridii]|uniref:Tryptophan 2-monooxygenase n=1 Tax=Rhodophyticola porphyridii TaxID=1852017 RepID=A0A3L9Y9F6_9RHOB|nr:FAD-dependent oxidoreductase [Rhodophyticola porphyridii]RMA43767.1 hypothetical protein D9R08_02255 [Rhodophyticola porphyridii]
MASNLPIKLNARVEKVLQGAGSVTLDTSAGTISAKAAIITASTGVLASGSIGFSPGSTTELLDIIGDLPCGKYEKVALAVTDLPPETAGKIFCMIDPGSGARAIDFQIMSTSPPVLIAHLAGDAAGPAIGEGGPAMIALATERLVHAFGSDLRRGIIASGTSDWSHNPLILGSYSNARPGAAAQRRRAISMETDNIVFAGEAFAALGRGRARRL